MRVTYIHALTIASAALLVGPALAQEPAVVAIAPSVSQTELRPGEVRASNLLGAMVKRLTGDVIGEVEDLIVTGDADVRLAVISVGGILGLGAKTIAVPFEEFEIAPDGATVYLSLTEEDLRARPAFDLDDTRAPAQAPAERGDTDEQTRTEPSEPHAAPVETHDTLGAPRLAAGDRGLDAILAAPKAKATKQPVSALIGAEVIDGENLPIGTIKDLMVTAEPPEVQVVVELSGASGVSARYVAVPLGAVSIPRGHGVDPHRQIERVETSLKAEQLEVLPR
jgi:sporulation protein YlmC with PRC-barrel domain